MNPLRNSTVTQEVRAITRFRKRVYVKKGGVPMLNSKQLAQVDPVIVKDIKEQFCFVADDIEQVLTDAASRDDLQHIYQLLDGETVVLGSDECASAAEALFQPELAGYEFLGIADTVVQSICKCDPTQQADMFANIILAGGNTMFPGFRKRLSHEICRLAPAGSTPIMVHADPERQNLVWYGGSVLASLPTIRAQLTSNSEWITKQEYDESGRSAVHRRYGF